MDVELQALKYLEGEVSSGCVFQPSPRIVMVKRYVICKPRHNS